MADGRGSGSSGAGAGAVLVRPDKEPRPHLGSLSGLTLQYICDRDRKMPCRDALPWHGHCLASFRFVASYFCARWGKAMVRVSPAFLLQWTV